ncbi:signal peptidase I, partial [bacterium]|nr:signal peptidase I [bacterium]
MRREHMAAGYSGTIRASGGSLAFRAFKKTVDIILTVIFILAVTLVVYIIYNKTSNGNVRIDGYHMYVVSGGSMRPTIQTGSIVVVRSVRPEDILPGDIITFRLDGGTG